MDYPIPSLDITTPGFISVLKAQKATKITHLALGTWVFKANFTVWDLGLFIAFILTA